MGVQLWIENHSLNLPVKYSIAYYDPKNGPRYEATFPIGRSIRSCLRSVFYLVPPPAAAPVRLVPLTKK